MKNTAKIEMQDFAKTEILDYKLFFKKFYAERLVLFLAASS